MSHNPLLFFKRFLANPVEVGAFFPTSLSTARVMAAPLNPAGTVLEMGAGTGAITRGIVERMPDTSRLTSIELDEALAAIFRKNFPNVRLITGDAEETLRNGTGWDTIVSGIPFSIMEPVKRARMFGLIKQKLNAGGTFVAIQYSLSSKADLERMFRDVQVRFSPLNLPPTAVYVCREPIV